MAQTFRYLRPASPLEAATMRAEHGRGAMLWAGGTDLLLQWRRGAIDIDYCIDLSGLGELRRIETGDDTTTIGALVTIATLQADARLAATLPVLAAMASHFATPQVRNVATVGGNLCHAVPSADCAPPLIALDAEVTLLSPAGERTLPLESFFVDAKRTALGNDEMLTHITIPHPPARSACTYRRMARSSVDIALAAAACRLDLDDRRIVTRARIVLGAVAPVPLRSRPAETLLMGNQIGAITDQVLYEVGELAAADASPISDVRTSAAYRRHMTGVLTRRAVRETTRSLAS